MAEQRGKHVVLPVLFALAWLPVLQGCAPEPTEEDHPYYLNYRDTKQALARVVEARPDDLFVFPTDAPEGVNDILSYTSNEYLKQMFYVYQGVRVESCIAVSPEECSERGEGESEYLIASGVDGGKKWRVFATATTGGLVATELGGRSPAADVPSPPEEWGSMDSPPQVPQPSESVDRVLELWEGYTFTTESEPAWITEYAQDPPVCEPDCY